MPRNELPGNILPGSLPDNGSLAEQAYRLLEEQLVTLQLAPGELVAEKDSIRLVEQRLQRKHLERLQHGQSESIETSNIHQETLRALKQINTSFALVGYPILLETGDLLQSRLSATPEGGAK